MNIILVLITFIQKIIFKIVVDQNINKYSKKNKCEKKIKIKINIERKYLNKLKKKSYKTNFFFLTLNRFLLS